MRRRAPRAPVRPAAQGFEAQAAPRALQDGRRRRARKGRLGRARHQGQGGQARHGRERAQRHHRRCPARPEAPRRSAPLDERVGASGQARRGAREAPPGRAQGDQGDRSRASVAQGPEEEEQGPRRALRAQAGKLGQGYRHLGQAQSQHGPRAQGEEGALSCLIVFSKPLTLLTLQRVAAGNKTGKRAKI